MEFYTFVLLTRSDQHLRSPNNIKTLFSRQVRDFTQLATGTCSLDVPLNSQNLLVKKSIVFCKENKSFHYLETVNELVCQI